jgi:hypothetical protein
VLRRIFGLKRGKVTGGWRKLHNEELHNFYSSLNIIRMIKSRRMRWAGHVARMMGKRKAYTVSVGKPRGKRPLGRPMDLREIGWGTSDWIYLALNRGQWRALVNMVMNLWVP